MLKRHRTPADRRRRHHPFQPLLGALLTLGLVLPALALGGCSSEPPTVALVLPESGPSAVYGQAVARGVRLAHRELAARHRAGSYPYAIELRVADTTGDSEAAAEQLRTAYEEGAVAAIGAVTDAEAQEMVRVAKQEERVLMAPTPAKAELAGLSRHVFHLQPSATREADKIGSFAVLELDLTNAVVLAPKGTADSDLVSAFRTQFERNGGEVLTVVDYVPAAGAAADAVARALERGPQAVYLAVSVADPAAREVVEVLRRQGFRGAVLTTSAFAAPSVVEAIGRGGEGLILSRSAYDANSERAEARAFVEAYREDHGEHPPVHAAYGYDAMMVLARALEEEEANPRQIWKGLRGLSEYQGVTGFIQFDEQGEVGQFPRVYVVERGELAPFRELDEGAKRRLVSRLERLESLAARSTASTPAG